MASPNQLQRNKDKKPKASPNQLQINKNKGPKASPNQLQRNKNKKPKASPNQGPKESFNELQKNKNKITQLSTRILAGGILLGPAAFATTLLYNEYLKQKAKLRKDRKLRKKT